MERGVGLARDLGLWGVSGPKPGTWAANAGVFAARDAVGVAAELRRQVTANVAGFARGQASRVKVGGSWAWDASGAAGVELRW